MAEESQTQVIRENAMFAVEQFGALTSFEFCFDRRSVEWVEGFIERQRQRGDDHYKMIGIIGSFLGQTIIATAGGEWVATEGTYGVRFHHPDSHDTCFPYTKVAKQFERGLAGGESILAFYDDIVNFFAKGIRPPSPD